MLDSYIKCLFLYDPTKLDSPMLIRQEITIARRKCSFLAYLKIAHNHSYKYKNNATREEAERLHGKSIGTSHKHSVPLECSRKEYQQ